LTFIESAFNKKEQQMRAENAQLWVHDQDEALAFYTEKLGMEVYEDVTLAEMGDFRWLTVRTPGADHGIVLMAIPGEPVIDEATKEQISVLMGKGFAGTVFFTTDDVYKDYEELKSRGVEFTDEPFEQPYGTRRRLPRPVG
jgi:catechol 2,3-dioxygenase-like lactoylglutathione lyase family enzyme